MLAFFLLTGVREWALAQDAYKVISTQEDFEPVIESARQLLKTYYAIVLRLPVKGSLVTGAELDALYGGAYRGAEVGLYRYRSSLHEIYVMKDMSKDECTATTCHELVHAWQKENCPADQDILVSEGLARWIEYKILDKTGAYTLARGLFEHADPVYGVGFKTMLEWEDKLGEMGVVLKAKRVKTLQDE